MHKTHNVFIIALTLLITGCAKRLISIPPNADLQNGHGLALFQVSSTDRYVIDLTSYRTQETIYITAGRGSSYWLLDLPADDYYISRVDGMEPRGSGFRFSVKPGAITYAGDVNIVPGRTTVQGNMLVYEGGFYKNYDPQGAIGFLTANYPRHSKALPFIDAAKPLIDVANGD